LRTNNAISFNTKSSLEHQLDVYGFSVDILISCWLFAEECFSSIRLQRTNFLASFARIGSAPTNGNIIRHVHGKFFLSIRIWRLIRFTCFWNRDHVLLFVSGRNSDIWHGKHAWTNERAYFKPHSWIFIERSPSLSQVICLIVHITTTSRDNLYNHFLLDTFHCLFFGMNMRIIYIADIF